MDCYGSLVPEQRFLNILAGAFVRLGNQSQAEHRFILKSRRNWTNERIVPISPRQLMKEAYKQLIVGKGLSAVVQSDIYMRFPYEIVCRTDQQVTKHRFVCVPAVAAIRLKEDGEPTSTSDSEEHPAKAYV